MDYCRIAKKQLYNGDDISQCFKFINDVICVLEYEFEKFLLVILFCNAFIIIYIFWLVSNKYLNKICI